VCSTSFRAGRPELLEAGSRHPKRGLDGGARLYKQMGRDAVVGVAGPRLRSRAPKKACFEIDGHADGPHRGAPPRLPLPEKSATARALRRVCGRWAGAWRIGRKAKAPGLRSAISINIRKVFGRSRLVLSSEAQAREPLAMPTKGSLAASAMDSQFQFRRTRLGRLSG